MLTKDFRNQLENSLELREVIQQTFTRIVHFRFSATILINHYLALGCWRQRTGMGWVPKTRVEGGAQSALKTHINANYLLQIPP